MAAMLHFSSGRKNFMPTVPQTKPSEQVATEPTNAPKKPTTNTDAQGTLPQASVEQQQQESAKPEANT